MLEDQYTSQEVTRVADEKSIIQDKLAIEEPLELRLAGETIAITMRTPGDDSVLAKGFFFSEGFITDPSQVARVVHCGRTRTPEYGNVIDVLPAPGVLLNFEGPGLQKRGTLMSSACGVCGRTQIDDLIARCEPFNGFSDIPADGVYSFISVLGKTQPLFDLTGGVHAAAAFLSDGSLVACYEDVGRHNATDKVVGRLFESGMIGKVSVLVVSGRVSFEIVQKAAMARIPAIIGISAPTSLAVELSRALKLTLIGFARGGRWNIYTG